MSELSSSELIDNITDVLDRVWTDERKLRSLEANASDAHLVQTVASLGWFGLTAPEADGGLDMSPAVLGDVARLFGERIVTGSLAEQMLLPGLLLQNIDRETTSGAVCATLRQAAEGTTLIALVDHVSMHSSFAPVAELSVEEAQLSGTTPLVRFAAEADVLLVRATRSGQETLLLIPADRPGVDIRPWTSGDPGATFARVQFDGVQISDEDAVVWSPGKVALPVLMESWLRVLLACEMTGLARHAHELSIEYVKQREQFGRPVGSFQAMQHLAAENVRRRVSMESFCAGVLEDSAAQSAEEFAGAAAALKGFVSENARVLCEDVLQMHGGIGFTHEYEFHWYYKRVMGLENWYGNAASLAGIVGRASFTAGGDAA